METETLVSSQETTTETKAKAGAKQKDTVYALALEALSGQSPAAGQPLKSLVTKEVRKAIRTKLFEGIKSGAIAYSKPGKPDGALKKYCSSLINNWLKKDSRFN